MDEEASGGFLLVVLCAASICGAHGDRYYARQRRHRLRPPPHPPWVWGGTRDQDAFHLVYQPLAGDGVILARVVSVTGNSANGSAGVMVRETLDAGAANAKTADWPAFAHVYFDLRSATGGSTAEPANVAASLPYW